MLSKTLVVISLLVSAHLALAGPEQVNTNNPTSAPSLTEVQRKTMAGEIESIAAIYRDHYAPKLWKESHLGWNIEAEVREAQAKIQSAKSMYDSRLALIEFFNSTADYHVGYGFFATGRSTLPLQVKTIAGKTLIVYIDRSKLAENVFPFSVGDELVEMDGVSVAQILKDLEKLVGPNVAETDLALADIYLTRRSARRNAPIPVGPVTLTLKKAGEEATVTHQLVWEHTPEKIKSSDQNVGLLKVQTSSLGNNFPGKKEKTKSLIALKNPQMYSPFAKEFMNLENPWGLGERNSVLPSLGKRIWETNKDNEFDAYIYKNEAGKLIGVLRIPSYSPNDIEKAMVDFVGVMKKMNEFADGLVIDQLNNPGGSVFYLYAMVSTMASTSMSTPRHRMNITAADVQEAVTTLDQLKDITNNEQAIEQVGKTLSGYPNSYQMIVNIREFCRFIIEQWNQGKKLTDPYYIWGVDRINPHPEVQFTKPVIVLVNELDFSGGDFFPAIMQDNKRVKVVGTRTAGAGGYVLEATFPNSFGLESFSFTGSIAERLDLNPIENLGVTPDVPLAFTVEDIRNDFKDYLSAVKKTIDGLVSQ